MDALHFVLIGGWFLTLLAWFAWSLTNNANRKRDQQHHMNILAMIKAQNLTEYKAHTSPRPKVNNFYKDKMEKAAQMNKPFADGVNEKDDIDNQ